MLYYNITQDGRQALKTFVTANKFRMPKMDLPDLRFKPGLEEARDTQRMVWPLEILILEDFAYGDHGLDMKEIKDRYGSEGAKIFKTLHRAGYFSADEG